MDKNGTKWVVIPSLKNGSENFEKNVEKLKMLSYRTWCTKTSQAEKYLKNGDFHIFMKNGEPKLCLKFFKNSIVEIQGEKNDNIIPIEYLDILQEHISKLDNTFLIERVKNNLKTAESLRDA